MSLPKIYQNEIKQDEILQQMPENNFVLHPRIIGQSARESFTDYANPRLKEITLYPGDDIQKALESLKLIDGGVINLRAGTYFINTSIDIPSAIQIKGENRITTIIDFNNTAGTFKATGTDIYTTGTITSITNGVIVAGSGTAWLANLTTDHEFYIAQKWYRIASIDTDTQLTLAEGYAGGATFPGAAYRAVKIKKDIEISELTFKNSTGAALDLDDIRNILLEDIDLIDNNIGITADNGSELAWQRTAAISNTSHGFQLTGCGFAVFREVSGISNGGSGVVMDTCRICPFHSSASNANTVDGFNLTSCSSILMECEAASNTEQGIELVSGNTEIIIENSQIHDNTSDGIKLTGTDDNNIISTSIIKGNGGYGVNIAAATDDTNIVVGNFFSTNTSGNLNDVGTGTRIKSNLPSTLDQTDASAVESKFLQMHEFNANVAEVENPANVRGLRTTDAVTAYMSDIFYFPSGVTISSVKVYMISRSGASYNVVLNIEFMQLVNNDAPGATDSSGNTTVTINTGAAGDVSIWTVPATAYDALTTGSSYAVRLSRIGGDVADTANGEQDFLGVEIVMA